MEQEVLNLPLSYELLNYYRDRLERCEKDYEEALGQVDSIALKHEEAHKAAWEAHKRAEEIAQVQRQLSDAELQLFDEKRTTLRLLAENDALKGKSTMPFLSPVLEELTVNVSSAVQELKDRKKIRYLLKLTPLDEQETTYFRDKIDQRLIKKTARLFPVKPSDPNSPDRQLPVPSEPDFQIVEDELAALRLTVTALRTQLTEQQQSYEATIAGLLRDRQTHLEEEKARRENESHKIDELMQKLAKLRALCRENVRELLYVKKTWAVTERKLVEDKMKLTEQVERMSREVEDEKYRSQNAEKTVETRLSKKHDTLIHSLRTQLAKYESELHTQKIQHTQEISSQQKKVSALQSRLGTLTSTYSALKKRRDYEIEGFTNDILNLRKQMKHLERGILRFAPLDHREMVLLKIAEKVSGEVERISTDVTGIKQRVYAAEEDLRNVKY
ncbi:hypothetical protein BC832DRAFT_593803 [Gaertneriomyces semiglobifer]|nr:hypothetical protein BC832DRAFT_593803 [Gaertneriomyces semiglobifer]